MVRACVRRLLEVWLLALLALPAMADETTEGDRTLSPYFFVHGDGVTDQLPLKSTNVPTSANPVR